MSLLEFLALLIRLSLFALVLFGLVRFSLFVLTRGKEKQKKQIIKEKTQENQQNRGKSYLLLRVLKYQSRGPEFTEQFLISLHSLYKTFTPADALKGVAYQDVLSLEMIHKGGNILFVLQCYTDRVSFLISQIYSQYPDVDIEETTHDPFAEYKHFSFVTAVEICLTRLIAPIRLLADTGGGPDVHPFTSFLWPLTRLDARTEGLLVQCLIEPVGNDWHAEGQALIQKIREGKFEEVTAGAKKSWYFVVWNVLLFPFIVVFRTIYKLFTKQAESAPAVWTEEKKEDVSLTELEKILMNAYQSKILSFGFAVTIRLAYFTNDENKLKRADSIFLTMLSAWKPHEFFGSHFQMKSLEKVLPASWLQKLFQKEKKVPLTHEEMITIIQKRLMSDKNRMVLNTKEISSLFHLPYTAMTLPNIAFAAYRKLQPPANLPLPENAKQELVLIGRTNYRNEHKLFGIQKDDRRRHMYVIGKTGMGKSTFLSNMIYDDIQNGRGVCVIDPHGDLANDALIAVPESRIQDVVYMCPADYQFPVSFNMFDVGDDPQKKFMAASGIVTTLKKLFDSSWGPRLEYILRNTCIALMDTPGSTFLSILRMYNEEYFRNMVVANIKDEVVKSFWINEFGRYDQKQIIENVGSIQNKVGQFLSNAVIRNLICQQKNTIDIRRFMDEGKIVIINLSKGLIGEDNAALLGSMLITKIQIDAMSRADTEEADRRDFYLYVDEFQNFATDAFATILSEARKYKLNLCMANQYVRQMPDTVRDAVFGNVGTLITHQVGVDDVGEFVKAYSNAVSESDLLEIAKYKYYTRMLIDGMPSIPFSADALPPPRENKRPEVIRAAIESSRSLYAKPREQVEQDIDAWSKDFIDPRKIEKEKEAMDKKAAYEARKAQLIAEGKWDPEGRKKEQSGPQSAPPVRKYPPRRPPGT